MMVFPARNATILFRIRKDIFGLNYFRKPGVLFKDKLNYLEDEQIAFHIKKLRDTGKESHIYILSFLLLLIDHNTFWGEAK